MFWSSLVYRLHFYASAMFNDKVTRPTRATNSLPKAARQFNILPIHYAGYYDAVIRPFVRYRDFSCILH